MPVHVTYHSVARGSTARVSAADGYKSQEQVPVLGKQVQPGYSLAVGAVANSLAADGTYLARIHSTEICRVTLGEGAVAVNNQSEYWPAGHTDVRYINKGERVSVIASA